MGEDATAAGGIDLGIEGLEDVAEIGRGGFAVVYRARQPVLNRMVAIKMLGSPLDAADREKVAREAWAMGTLSGHPNIVNVLDVGVTASGADYISMSYLPQGSLASRIDREGPLTWTEAVRIGIKLAGALETAHLAGTLHRDVKPENVLLSDYGEPQLTDFGIARVQGRFEKATGQLTASLVHSPPEVLDGRPATVAADVYSLGSTLFTLLAGRPAFTRRPDEALASLFLRIARDPIPDLRVRGVPDSVSRVVEQAMAKDPAKRPRSAAEFGRQLQEVQRRAGLPVTDMALVLPDPSASATAAPTRATPAADLEPGGEETEGAVGAQPTSPPSGPAPPGPQRRQRRRWLAAGGAAALLVAVAALALPGGDTDSPPASAPSVPSTTHPEPGPPSTPTTAILPPGAVKVGVDPTAVVSDPRTGRVYVANSGSMSVSVVDGTTREVVATVPVSSRPWGIALNQRTGRVYVTTAESAVTVIDGASNTVLTTVPLSSRPWGIAVNHRTNRIYVASSESAVTVIDGETNAVTGSVPLTSRPWAVSVIPETNRLYVTSQESGTLSVIDGEPARVAATVDLGTRSCGAATNPRSKRVYVTSLDSGRVTVIDADSFAVIGTVAVEGMACGVTVNSQTNRVYVSNQETGTVSVIDANTSEVITSRALFGPTRATEVLPNDVDVNPQGDGLYAVNKSSGSLVTAAGDLS